MEFEKADVTRYMYTAGVLVSGVYLERWSADLGLMAILTLSLFTAVVWFLYYKFILVDKIEAVQDRSAKEHVPTEIQDDR